MDKYLSVASAKKKKLIVVFTCIALISVVAIGFVLFLRSQEPQPAGSAGLHDDLPVRPGMAQPAQSEPVGSANVAAETSHLLEDLEYFLYVMEDSHRCYVKNPANQPMAKKPPGWLRGFFLLFLPGPTFPPLALPSVSFRLSHPHMCCTFWVSPHIQMLRRVAIPVFL